MCSVLVDHWIEGWGTHRLDFHFLYRDCSSVLMHQLFFVLFQDSISLYGPGWLRIHYVGQTDFKLRESCLCLLSAGVKGVHHHTSLTLTFLIRMDVGISPWNGALKARGDLGRWQ